MPKPDYDAAMRNADTSIIINDLDSLVHRIEALEAHPHYTDALVAVQKAKASMQEGRSEIHQARMKKRFEEADIRRG